MADITRILGQIESGDSAAAEQLLPLVYNALRQLAAQKMLQENPGQTLQATALVHEAYLRLVDVNEAQRWDSRGHFFAAAAEAMRRILIEQARRKHRIRHGGDMRRIDDVQIDLVADEDGQGFLEFNDALDVLASTDPRAAEIVKLHLFAGLTLEEIAPLLQLSARSAYRDWAFARAWLARQLGEPQN